MAKPTAADVTKAAALREKIAAMAQEAHALEGGPTVKQQQEQHGVAATVTPTLPPQIVKVLHGQTVKNIETDELLPEGEVLTVEGGVAVALFTMGYVEIVGNAHDE